MIFLLFGSALSNTGVSFINKKLITRGMTGAEYFYYVTIALVPLSAIFFFLYPFTTAINFTVLMLLLASVGIRAINSLSLSRSLKTITPLTLSVYSTMAILLTYFIDVIIGSVTFNIVHFSALMLIILGTVIIIIKNLQVLKQVKTPVILRVLSEMLKGYLAYFALKHMNTAMYTFLIAVLTTIIIVPFTKQLIGSFNAKKMKHGVIAQIIGVSGLILANLLAKSSATLFMLITP
ncbi:MAG: hypothetical protein CVV59_01680, partial [Tenericutes bacterium HGW-Tenericutes-4]